MAKEIAYKVTVDTSTAEKGVERTTDEVEKLGNQTKKTSKEMKSGFNAASKSAKLLPAPLQNAAMAAGNLTTGVRSAVTAMKSLKIAIMATGIGALLIAVASLVAYFTETERGAQKLRVAMAAVGAAIGVVKDVMVGLGESFVQFFSGDFSGAVDTLKNSFSGLGDELIKDTKAAIALEQAMNKVKVQERELGVERAKALKVIAEARLAAEDETKSAEERVEKLKEVAALESALTAKELANEEEKLRILREQAALNESDEATLQAVADQEAKVAQVQLASLNLNRRLKTELNSLEREIETERSARAKAEEDRIKGLNEAERKALEEKAAIEAEKNAQELELKRQLEDAKIQLIIDSENREIELAELNLERRLEQIQGNSEIELELRKALVELSETEIQAIKDKYAAQGKEKRKKAAADELEGDEKLYRAKIRAAQNVGNALGAIGSLIAQQGKENTAAAKTLAVAQILIDTAIGVAGAVRIATQSSATPWDMIAGIAAGIAAVIAGIASATSILNQANVGGATAPQPSSSYSSAAQAPQFNPVTTNTTELGNTQQAELAPIQAFVVETELTGTQENVGQIESQATFE